MCNCINQREHFKSFALHKFMLSTQYRISSPFLLFDRIFFLIFVQRCRFFFSNVSEVTTNNFMMFFAPLTSENVHKNFISKCFIVFFVFQVFTLVQVCRLPLWMYTTVLPYGLVARISGFHPEGPGSIPGMGNFFKSLS